MTDDSAGLVALDLLKKTRTLPGDIEVMDGGTLGLDLLAYMEGYENILIVDCVMRGKKPGEVIRVEAEEIETVFAKCLSPHQMGLKDLIAVLRLQERMPARMTVVGIEGVTIGLGTELTPHVAQSIAPAVDLMVQILAEWGHEIH